MLGYRLFYDIEGTDSYAEVELPADAKEYIATLLDPDIRYRFQVTARASCASST